MFRLVFTLLGGVISPINNTYGFWILAFYFDIISKSKNDLADAKSLFAFAYENGTITVDVLFTRIIRRKL